MTWGLVIWLCVWLLGSGHAVAGEGGEAVRPPEERYAGGGGGDE